MAATKNAWAVGYTYNGTDDVTLVAHYNGHSWSKVASPTLGSTYSELTAIGASSSTSIWAVGQYNSGSEESGSGPALRLILASC